jgi:hypothetical protein
MTSAFGSGPKGKHAVVLEADYSAIGTAGTGFSAAAGRLRDIDVAGPLSAAQDAVVGSRTSEACLWVASRLGSSVQVYADRVEAMSSLADATVDAYEGNDTATQQAFRGALR